MGVMSIMKQRKFLYTFIFSYVMILIVPIIIFSIVVYTYINHSYTNEILKRYQHNLDHVSINLSSQIQNMNQTANQMNLDTDFSSYQLAMYPYKFLSVEKKMRQYGNTNDFPYEILFSSNTTGYLYGSFNYDINRYCRDVLTNKNYSQNAYKDTFSATSKPTWIPMSAVTLKGIDMLITTYVVPVEKSMSNANITRSTAIFHIKDTSFKKLLAPLLVNDVTEMIVDIDGVNIYHNNPAFYNALNHGPSTVHTKSSYQTTTIHETSYYVLKNSKNLQAQNMGIHLYISAEYIKKDAHHIVLISILSLIGSMLLGLVFILLALKYNYKPIKHLSDYALVLSQHEDGSLNELDNAKYALEQLNSQNQHMAYLHSQYALERTLLKLISHTRGDKEILIKACTSAGINISCNYYVCMTLDLDINMKNEQLFNKSRFFECISHYNTLYSAEFIEYNNLVLLLGHDFDDYVYINHILADIIPEFFHSNTVSIGIGNFVDNLCDLNQSYCQSLIALNRCKSHAVSTIFFHEISNLTSKSLIYDRKDFNNLYQAIISLDANKIRRSSQLLKKTLRSFEHNDYVWLYMAHDLVNTCIQALNSLEISTEELFNKYTYILHRANFTSIDHVIKVVNELTKEVNDIIETVDMSESKNKAKKSCLEIREILHYIDNHYKHPNFSVKVIANEFNTSISNLSHFFKGKTNQNISSYINHLRMEESKKLLRETDLTISQIVTEIGGIYASSFIRNFKKSMGVTPGEYREKNRK